MPGCHTQWYQREFAHIVQRACTGQVELDIMFTVTSLDETYAFDTQVFKTSNYLTLWTLFTTPEAITPLHKDNCIVLVLNLIL